MFQFYDYDTALFVKTYKLENKDKIAYNSNMNPNINLIRNSIFISLTSYNQRPMTKYLFLNNPNSKDVILNGNKILVKDLIGMENTIYKLNLKLKILEIPNNFIFIKNNISISNNIEIKAGDILELDSEIILRQYRIKEGSFIFKYKGIAEGDDSGFLYSKIYPSNHDIPKDNEIYFEGKEGHLVINFDECLEGYYKLEDDVNICTNKNPEGYYLDEKDEILKQCKEPCLECSGPYISENEMNCISCIANYTITEDTHSCYNYVPLNYTKDNNILRRCHKLCTQCIKPSKNDSDMSCLQCEYGYFLKTDHNCIRPEDFEKRQTQNLAKTDSGFKVLFIVIFISALIASIAICLQCLCKYDGKNEEKRDNEENQNIINGDEDDDSQLLTITDQNKELLDINN